MSDPKYNFLYIPKLIIFSEDTMKVLLAKRKGEADYDGAFSFIGGKMETSDGSIVEAIRREKTEEIGEAAKIRVYLPATNNVLFRKSDGSQCILPHYLAMFAGGEIKLNEDEYSEYRWAAVDDLSTLNPKIENIPDMVNWALALKSFADTKDFVEV